jgi:tetratricopeptide (TPR) repeat protein
MKLMTTTAALAFVAVSAPAAGQYGASAPPPQRVEQPMQQPQQAPTEQGTAQQAPTVKPSKQAMKAIVDLQTAVKSNDVANIPAKVAAAQAVAQTKEDRYLIAVFQRQAAIAANNNVALASATEALANSGVLDTAKIAALYLDLGAKQFNAKQYSQAVAAFQRAATLTPNDPETLELVAQGMAAGGQYGEAAGAFQRAIRARVAAGQKPDEMMYRRALSAAYEAHLPTAAQLARDWVTAYPTPDSWRNAIAVFRNGSHQDEEGTLDLLRLMQATGAMSTAGDYALFAETAADQSNYNEAQTVIDAGIAAHVVDPSSAQFRDIVAALKSKPKATAADLEAASKMSPSAINLLRIGDRYYGMGNYGKAAEVYRQVAAKPGADRELANLHLGMALARAGDKAGATAALNAVTGARSDIAKYWLVYVQQHA